MIGVGTIVKRDGSVGLGWRGFVVEGIDELPVFLGVAFGVT